MLKRPEQILKLGCLLLVAVICLQVARVIGRGTPLKNLTVPALPKLAVSADSTNTPASQGSSTNTNSTAVAKTGTNATGASGTNSSAEAKKQGTNTVEVKSESKGSNTVGAVSTSETNKPVEAAREKSNDVAAAVQTGTNSVATTNSLGTNDLAATAQTETNLAKLGITNNASGTNGPDKNAKGGTNASNQKMAARGGPGGRPQMGMKLPELSPAMKSRVDRITQSEILAPVPHPMPMALLGIAGDQAFLRSPEGQTGMIKEGAELGTIKLLKVGTNRVLVEEKGEKKELMIFSGFGGESLMPKEVKKEEKKDEKKEEKTKPNETTKKSA